MKEKQHNPGDHPTAKLAGLGYAGIIALGIFAEFIVRSSLVAPGNADTTFQQIRANELLFRMGIGSYLLMAVLDASVAIALYLLFKPFVSTGLSLLTALFRLAHALLLAVAISHLLNVIHHLTMADKAPSTADLPGHIMASLQAFNDTWLIALLFFGLHCALLGTLIIQSRYLPQWIGWLLTLAAAGYLVDGFARVLLSQYNDYERLFLLVVAIPAFTAEIALCLGLLLQPVANKKTP